MIDINIAEQLFPSPESMVVQLCATAILFYFLKKYLWGPARDLMEKRSASLHATVTEAEDKLQNALKTQAEADQRVKDSYKTSSEIIAKAENEAKNVREELIHKAKKEADSKLEKARIEIDKQKQQMRNDMIEEMIDVAMVASEKLIEDKVDESYDKQAIEKFVKEVSK